MKTVSERLCHYTSFDTQADDTSLSAPSSAKQLILAQELYDECVTLGFDKVEKSEAGIVYATLESTGLSTNIGLCSHMDTALELPGKANARLIKNYDGKTIHLNDAYTMSPNEYEVLGRMKGHDLIVTDGTTLLGADDKAGIAIILQALDEIIHSDKPHGRIVVALTVDEEIGRGTDHMDLNKFNVDYAYTVDGAHVNGIEYETFNAAQAKIKITGRAIHPGDAKNKMISAADVAMHLANLFPQSQTPATTEGREGFYHLVKMEGTVEEAELTYIIRDHDWDSFEKRKEFVVQTVDYINKQYPDCVKLDLHDQYHNMVQYMNGDFKAVKKAQQAIQNQGLEPVSIPVRGGTDGSRLTEMGIITPNLGTGSYNHHGRYEFASVQEMECMVRIVKDILYTEDE